MPTRIQGGKMGIEKGIERRALCTLAEMCCYEMVLAHPEPLPACNDYKDSATAL